MAETWSASDHLASRGVFQNKIHQFDTSAESLAQKKHTSLNLAERFKKKTPTKQLNNTKQLKLVEVHPDSSRWMSIILVPQQS